MVRKGKKSLAIVSFPRLRKAKNNGGSVKLNGKEAWLFRYACRMYIPGPLFPHIAGVERFKTARIVLLGYTTIWSRVRATKKYIRNNSGVANLTRRIVTNWFTFNSANVYLRRVSSFTFFSSLFLLFRHCCLFFSRCIFGLMYTFPLVLHLLVQIWSPADSRLGTR